MARVMKDSGIDLIGMIPVHWDVKKAKYIASSFQKGNGITKEEIFLDGDIQCVRYGEIYSKYEQQFTNTVSLTKLEEISSPRYIYHGDILFAGTGELVEEIGKNIVFLGNEPCLAGGDIIIMKHSQNPIFMNYALNSICSQQQKSKGKAKLKVVHISATDIGNVIIALPSLNEQEKIAKILNDKVGEIDIILSRTRESIVEYKKYKNAVVAEAITKGLDRNVTMRESGIEWIGKIPSHWKVHTLSQVFTQLKNKNSDMSEKNLLSLSYGKIKRKDINSSDGLLPESFESYNIIDKNDIVLRLTDLQNDHKSLRVGHVKERGIITSAYVTLRCKEGIATDYYYYFLHTFDIFKGFYGMGAGVRQGLNYEGIRSMKILSPDIKEQRKIVEYLNAKCAEIDALIAKKEAFIEEMETYKKSLIYEYVTGKKEVE